MATAASSLDRLSEALSIVKDELSRLDQTLMSADAPSVKGLVGVFDGIGRAAGAGWVMSARRAAELELHSSSGHRNATDWLAQASGVSFAKAKEALSLAERLQPSVPVKEAFARGELTLSQAAVIADALDVAPGSGESMLKTAENGSLQELSQQGLRAKQAVRSRDDERKRRARAFQRRSLRFTQLPEGGVRVQGYLTDESWARCLAPIDAVANRLFRLGRSAKVPTTLDQRRADALVDVVAGGPLSHGQAHVETLPVDGDGHVDVDGDRHCDSSAPDDVPGDVASGSGKRLAPTSVTVIVRIDAAALRRGWVEAGEMCEIAGVGPVSVDTARELLGEWYFRLLVTDGTDVTTITGRHRHVPARVEAALLERDRSCVVPHCGMTVGLETHHWRVEVRAKGPTVLDNLCRLCSVHHGLASNAGWTVRGGPGRWEWVGPDYPVSTQLQQTRRRIAAARGRSPSD